MGWNWSSLVLLLVLVLDFVGGFENEDDHENEGLREVTAGDPWKGAALHGDFPVLRYAHTT